MGLEHRWSQFLEAVKTEIHATSMELFELLVPVEEAEDELVLSHPSEFMAGVCADSSMNGMIFDMVVAHWPGAPPKS